MKAVVIRHIKSKMMTLSDEILHLTKAANYELFEVLKFQRFRPNQKTFIPQGLLENLLLILEENQISKIIVDGNISPKQLLTLEDITSTEILDKTMLVLEIFSTRANSADIQLQVQLAQLKYSIPRMVSKLGESVKSERPGFGGTGEQVTELLVSDIKRRIRNIENKLTIIKNRLSQQESSNIPRIPIMGFYSAGKTTIFNHFTKLDRETGKKAFTTMIMKSGRSQICGFPIELIDTVGLIGLPHDVINAFDLMLNTIFSYEGLVICLDTSLNIDTLEEQLIKIVSYFDKFSRSQNVRVIFLLTKTDLTMREDIDCLKELIHDSTNFEDYKIIESRSNRFSEMENEFVTAFDELFSDKLLRFHYENLLPHQMSNLYEIARIFSQEWQKDGTVTISGIGPLGLLNQFERDLN